MKYTRMIKSVAIAMSMAVATSIFLPVTSNCVNAARLPETILRVNEPVEGNTTGNTTDDSSTSTNPNDTSVTLTPSVSVETTVSTTVTPSVTYDYSATTGIGGFVNRLYSVCLGRLPDASGFEDWYNQLRNGEITGAAAARGFLLSTEFISHNYSDSEYVDYLYLVFFDRSADNAGRSYWVDKLSSGISREEVLSGFIDSTEWANVCVSFGIMSGGTGVANEIPEANDDVKTFVMSLYQDCLDRTPDENGFQSWCNDLTAMRISGKAAAYGFFFSNEFTTKASTMTDEELVAVFYKVFLNRTPDEYGTAYWLEILSWGGGIGDLFNGFADSEEFRVKCISYGIFAGDHIDVPTSAADSGFLRFAEWEMDKVEIMNTAALSSHNYYTLFNVQGSDTTSSLKQISDADLEAIERFANSHFQPSWTAGQKALYTMYWIHENVTYASSSSLWSQISGMGYAQAIFDQRIGQCAQYNGALCEMLCYLGFDANMIQGYRGSSSSSRSQHFWCEVNINGTLYVMECGNAGHDGSWHYFCTPYENTRKFIKNGVVMGWS